MVKIPKYDLVGKRFGKLVVLERLENGHWLCRCDCGNLTSSPTTNRLIVGKTKSCGCYRREESSSRSRKHGMTKSRILNRFRGILSRCNNPHSISYKNYGAKGIKVCDEWSGPDGSTNFLKWAYEHGWDENCDRKNFTIDRIDPKLGYSPDNCRFVSMKTQGNNKTNNHLMTHNGETHTMQEWSEITSFSHSVISARVKRGWDDDRALTEPLHNNNRRKTN